MQYTRISYLVILIDMWYNRQIYIAVDVCDAAGLKLLDCLKLSNGSLLRIEIWANLSLSATVLQQQTSNDFHWQTFYTAFILVIFRYLSSLSRGSVRLPVHRQPASEPVQCVVHHGCGHETAGEGSDWPLSAIPHWPHGIWHEARWLGGEATRFLQLFCCATDLARGQNVIVSGFWALFTTLTMKCVVADLLPVTILSQAEQLLLVATNLFSIAGL